MPYHKKTVVLREGVDEVQRVLIREQRSVPLMNTLVDNDSDETECLSNQYQDH